MKIKLLTLLAILFQTPMAIAQSQELVTVKPEAVFTPKGFDTNDNAQIVIYGKFHDICHKVAPTVVTIEPETKRIYIRHRAYTTRICPEIFVTNPYSIIVDLGSLKKGSYEVLTYEDKKGFITQGVLPIAQAKKAKTDDHLYAPVREIVFQPTSDPTAPELLIRGDLYNKCLSLKEVRVSLTEGRIYDILPIMVAQDRNCGPSERNFETKVTLPKFPNSPVLLNVRSLGGQNIQKVIDLDRITQ